MVKKPEFDSVYGFAMTSANKGDDVSIGFQINIQDVTNEMRLTLSQNILDSIVYPAIINRALKNKLDPNFQSLRNAHLLMFSNPSKNKILLNDDVQIKALVRFVEGKTVQPNDEIQGSDIEEILGLYPNENVDPDAAHILFVKLKRKWNFACDLIYSRKRVKNLIVTSEKFLDTVISSLAKKHWSPFIDNLFTVNELLVQSILLLRYYQGYSKKQSHVQTSQLFKGFCETGNVPMEFFQNFDELWKLRRKARYLEGTKSEEFTLSEDKSRMFIDVTKRIFDYTNNLLKTLDLKSKPTAGQYITFGTKANRIRR